MNEEERGLLGIPNPGELTDIIDRAIETRFCLRWMSWILSRLRDIDSKNLSTYNTIEAELDARK